MITELPDHLKQSFNDSDYATVLHWWNALSPQDRLEISQTSELPTENHFSLRVVESMDSEEEYMKPFYDFLINHELRCVGYVDDTDAASSYRIVSHYLASLGAEMRHRRGTVE